MASSGEEAPHSGSTSTNAEIMAENIEGKAQEESQHTAPETSPNEAMGQSEPVRDQDATIDAAESDSEPGIESHNLSVPKETAEPALSDIGSGDEINWGFDDMHELLQHEKGGIENTSVKALDGDVAIGSLDVSESVADQLVQQDGEARSEEPGMSEATRVGDEQGAETPIQATHTPEASVEEHAEPVQSSEEPTAAEQSQEQALLDDMFAGVPSNAGNSNGNDFFGDSTTSFDELVKSGEGSGDTVAMANDTTENSNRFEEGLPLLSHEEPSDASTAAEKPTDSKAEDRGADFFDNISGPSENQDPFKQLERKSTEAAMGIGADAQVPDSTPSTEGQTAEASPADAKEDAKPTSTTDDLFGNSGPEIEFGALVSETSDGDFFSQLNGGDSTGNTQEDVKPKIDEEAFKSAFEDISDNEFLPDDDEGFLPTDDEEETKQTSTAPPQPANPYVPQAQPQAASYFPPQQQLPVTNVAAQNYAPSSFPGVQPAAPPPAPQQVESFVAKKTAYHSPYDLPVDLAPKIVKKRPAHPTQLSGPIPGGAMPPVRTSSVGAVSSPGYPAPPSSAPPLQQTYGHGTLPPTTARSGSRPGTSSGTSTSAQTKPAFFEELPTVVKPKTQNRYAPPSTQQIQRPSSVGIYPSTGQFQPPQGAPAAVPQGLTAPPPQINRYSPSPVAATGPYAPPVAPLAQASRYAPSAPGVPSATAATPQYAVPPAKNPSPYTPVPAVKPAQRAVYAAPPTRSATMPVGTMPHAQSSSTTQTPITSPQQQFNNPIFASPPRMNQHEGSPAAVQRHSAELYNLHSSRPPTGKSPLPHETLPVPKEEDESQHEGHQKALSTAGSSIVSPRQSMGPPNRWSATPPPVAGMTSIGGTLSPPKTRSQGFIPPPRAQTQSPSAVMRSMQHKDPYRRPNSALANAYQPSIERKPSLPQENFLPPMDGSAHDPLKRWQGAPIFKWGVGGTIVVTFPKRAQRFSSDISMPLIKCSPGEVKLKKASDYAQLDENVATFPGPLMYGGKANKSKKKEVITWLDTCIKKREEEALSGYGTVDPVHLQEKQMLWKTVKLLVEHDGVLEGSKDIEKAVREILWPEGAESTGADALPYSAPKTNAPAPAQEAASFSDVQDIKKKLLAGDREGAVWHAVDKRLWSHAMLISSTISKDVWKQVVQEFVRNEVKVLGAGTESLSTLYEIFSGSGGDSIDELVPQSARMGLPMLSRNSSTQITSNPLETINLWRETLTLILSNRSVEDVDSILALGRLLASYGRTEAAHICFIFSRQIAKFSGLDDISADLILLGSDRKAAGDSFGKDLDSVLLTEAYEMALGLPATSLVVGIPHLQLYKVYHAQLLAQFDRPKDAQKYCESISQVVRAAVKPSPYYSPALFSVLEDLTQRSSETPVQQTGGWLGKPSLDSVSGSVWSAFNKFVAGDDEGNTHKHDENGPFGKMSPSISRSASSMDMYGSFNNAYGSQQFSQGPYNPSPAYNPRASTESAKYAPPSKRSSSQSRGAYEPHGYGGGYVGYEPTPPGSASYSGGYPPQTASSYTSTGPLNGMGSPGYNPPAYHPFSPVSEAPGKQSFDSPLRNSFNADSDQPADQQQQENQGYQSYGGYEPPTTEFTPYQPDPESDEDKPKPKKKSFMDDDDDEFEAAAIKKIREEEEKKKKEEEKKKQEEKKDAAPKKGWFSWLARGKQDDSQPKVHKANLGEEVSFYYDPELKRWVNKKGGSEAATPVASTPPPPRASPASSRPPSVRPPSVAPEDSKSGSPTSSRPPLNPAATAPPPAATAPPPAAEGGSSAPPSIKPPPSPAPPTGAPTPPLPPASAPPGRVSTPVAAAKTGDIMDELLGPPGARKSGTVGRKKKAGRYVDVMASKAT